jgi:hypothetical protein
MLTAPHTVLFCDALRVAAAVAKLRTLKESAIAAVVVDHFWYISPELFVPILVSLPFMDIFSPIGLF